MQIRNPLQQPQAQPFVANDLTRGQKTDMFLKQVVPSVAGTAIASQIPVSSALSTSAITSTTAATTSSTGAALGSPALSGAGILGALYGGYDLISSWGKSTPVQGAASGAAVGAAVGSMFFPGPGTVIGAAAGGLIGGLMGMVKTGKHKDQVARDQVRGALQSSGFIDKDYSVSLADGSKYNIGIDGGKKAEFGGMRPYEVNFERPFMNYAVSWMNPLAELICGSNEKLKNDFCGYFANAVMSNATSIEDVAKNVATIFGQFGLDKNKLSESISTGIQQGRFDQATGAAYLNGVNEWSSAV